MYCLFQFEYHWYQYFLNIVVTKPQPLLKSVNCSDVKDVDPTDVRKMSSSFPPNYYVSLSWWDFRRRGKNQVVKANPSVRTIQTILHDSTDQGDALVDVGANVGFMVMYGLTQNHPVYAVEPISYNIAKLCEGIRANKNESLIMDKNYFIYHAAAGSHYIEKINITRPSDNLGKFDQASLSREAVLHGDTVTEIVPMIPLDMLIPDNIPIGIVKIDVQGNEELVVRGMTKILSRTSGFPVHIFYEENPLMIAKAGFVAGTVQGILEGYGYTCKPQHTEDILCFKPRKKAESIKRVKHIRTQETTNRY